jgi:WD40 repeat protein
MSGDGRWLATVSRVDAQLWDLTAPDPASTMRVLRGHRGPIWSVAISADSRWLVTDRSDGTLRRWSLDLDWLLEYADKIAGRELTRDERVQYDIYQ